MNNRDVAIYIIAQAYPLLYKPGYLQDPWGKHLQWDEPLHDELRTSGT